MTDGAFRGIAFQDLNPGLIPQPSVQFMSRFSRFQVESDGSMRALVNFHNPSSPVLKDKRRHLQERESALRILDQQMRKAESDREVRWLAENSAEFAGRWVALQGGELLAVADTAREVFSMTSGLRTPPLVLKIEAANVPFGGW